jgi:two-component system OmpR family response regulator
MTHSLLIVEDEASIRDPLAQYFENNQFRVRAVANAAEARKLLSLHPFDLVIADIMMPGEDGLSLCRHIRATTNQPVILLTARAEELDRILGLEVGADDYVVKPFSPRELLARVKAVLRRANAPPAQHDGPDSPVYTFDDWTLKTGERELVARDGLVVPLSSGEYALLLALVERPRLVLTREQLLDITQGREAAVFDRSVDNQISRLRRKIETDPKNRRYIKTVWGGGYSFSAEVKRL